MWCIWREWNRHTFKDMECSGSSSLCLSEGLNLINLELGDIHLLFHPNVYRFPYFLYIFFFLLFFGVFLWLLHVLFAKRFLWGGRGDDFKLHLVNWNTCCTPIHLGGLGIEKVVFFNQALLRQRLWQYGCEEKALWRLVIELKYHSSSEFRSYGSEEKAFWRQYGCDEKALINSSFCPTSQPHLYQQT